MRVLIADPLPDDAIEILEERQLDVEVLGDSPPEVVAEKIGEFDGVIVRSRTKLTADILSRAERLKVIARAGAGVDNIDVNTATRLGILVLNTAGANTISAAEHTMAMMLALARNIPQAHISLRHGAWERKRFLGTELSGKTLGIIGLGRIGREVAHRARAFDMKILAYDPYVQKEKTDAVTLCKSLEELLPLVEFLTVHTPRTPQTEGMISFKEFELMKDGVRIVNCARGGIIDEKALYDALRKGKVAGAALDVFENEPPLSSPLLEDERVVVTPHLGASTLEAQLMVARESAELIADALLNGVVRNAVNMPALDRRTLEEVTPFAELAEALGRFLALRSSSALREISIAYSGEVAKKDTRLITARCLAGLLQPLLGEKVNMVNSQMYAEERGLSLAEHKHPDGGAFSSLVEVSLQTDERRLSVAGTVYGKRELRVVSVDGFSVELNPSGYVILVYAEDKPGLIGSVGGILGRYAVNIAFMTFGRKEEGGEALAGLNLDSQPPIDAIREIEGLDLVTATELIDLG